MLAIIRCRIFSLPDKPTQKYKFSCCFYGCKAWSLALTGEHRLWVFESRVLRKILGSKRDDVAGEWRRLRKEELYDLYSTPNIIG
jgi:hypothetical protein